MSILRFKKPDPFDYVAWVAIGIVVIYLFFWTKYLCS